MSDPKQEHNESTLETEAAADLEVSEPKAEQVRGGMTKQEIINKVATKPGLTAVDVPPPPSK
jgi:hypothetical protein